MRLARSERSDFVIGMTLAEIFLLLLLVMWYKYSRDPLNPDNAARYQQELQRIQNINDSLSTKLIQASNKIDNLEKRLELWRSLMGREDPPSSQQELATWVKDLGRGNPRCEENNALIRAELISGRKSITLITESPRLLRWFKQKGQILPEIGKEVTDTAAIMSFLESVRLFYSEDKIIEKECRFDYNLIYGSKEDYFDARQLFERYFYPARLESINLAPRR